MSDLSVYAAYVWIAASFVWLISSLIRSRDVRKQEHVLAAQDDFDSDANQTMSGSSTVALSEDLDLRHSQGGANLRLEAETELANATAGQSSAVARLGSDSHDGAGANVSLATHALASDDSHPDDSHPDDFRSEDDGFGHEDLEAGQADNDSPTGEMADDDIATDGTDSDGTADLDPDLDQDVEDVADAAAYERETAEALDIDSTSPKPSRRSATVNNSALTMADVLTGIRLPYDLVPVVPTDEAPSDRRVTLVSGNAAPEIIGAAIADELERLDFSIRSVTTDTAIAERGDVKLELKIVPDAGTARHDGELRFPEASATAVAVSLEIKP